MPGSWTLLAGAVGSFQVGSDGTLYELDTYGSLYGRFGLSGAWALLAGSVVSFQIASDGTLYELK